MRGTNPPAGRRALLWDLGCGALAGALALAVAAVVLKLWDAKLHIPLTALEGDVTNSFMVVKMLAAGSWFHNDLIGAPSGTALQDYPFYWDLGQILAIKGVGLFFSDPARVFNAVYVLSYPAIAFNAYVALRWTGARRGPAVVVAVLFATLPFHFLRGQAHFFIGQYWAVPFSAALVYKLIAGHPLVARRDAGGNAVTRWLSGTTIATLAAGIATGIQFSYFAIFTLILIVLVAVIRFIAVPRRATLVDPVVALAFSGAAFVLMLAPTLLYRYAHGTNELVARRPPQQSEEFGLKLAQLLLPINDHRIGSFSRKAHEYATTAPLLGEGKGSPLGLLLGIGARPGDPERRGRRGACDAGPRPGRGAARERARRVAVLPARHDRRRLVAVRLPDLLPAARLDADLDPARVLRRDRVGSDPDVAALRTARRARRGGDGDRARGRRRLGCARPDESEVGAGLPRRVRVVGQRRAIRQADRAAGAARREDPAVAVLAVPRDAAARPGHGLRPLPADAPFEAPALELRRDAGRSADWGAESLADQPLKEVLPKAVAAGFAGVYVDTYTYADGGTAALAELAAASGETPSRSDDGRMAFVSLAPLAARLKAACSPAALRRAGNAFVHPADITWGRGFYEAQTDGPHTWHWAQPSASLTVGAGRDPASATDVTFSLRAATRAPQTVTVEPDGAAAKTVAIPAGGAAPVRLTIPPGGGAMRIRLSTDGPDDGVDARDLRMRVEDVRVSSDLACAAS